MDTAPLLCGTRRFVSQQPTTTSISPEPGWWEMMERESGLRIGEKVKAREGEKDRRKVLCVGKRWLRDLFRVDQNKINFHTCWTFFNQEALIHSLRCLLDRSALAMSHSIHTHRAWVLVVVISWGLPSIYRAKASFEYVVQSGTLPTPKKQKRQQATHPLKTWQQEEVHFLAGSTGLSLPFLYFTHCTITTSRDHH